jgi:2-polyprenyl-3-methyl-5-hydroxy-6-metoxy-1,4-benzoquinol methylase
LPGANAGVSVKLIMRKVQLNELMQGLYESEKYFVSIPLDESANGYEEGYHKVTIDPDGKKRHLLSERKQSLSRIKEITDYLDTLKGKKILDIGCGLGWLLSYLDDDWDKFGIEISKFASNHAQQYGAIFNGTLESYLDNSKFDVIILNHVIEHLESPIYTLNKIRNLLNDKGIFILGTPDFDSAAARRYGDRFRLLNDPTHISLFSSDSMHRCLRDQGFKIKKVEYPYFDTPYFNKDNLLKILGDKGISPPFYGSNMTFFCTKL